MISREEIETLGRYNAEVSRGIVHTPECAARMAEMQRRFDLRTAEQVDIWVTTEPIAAPRRRWWHQLTAGNRRH